MENKFQELPSGSVHTLLQEIITEYGFEKFKINVDDGSKKGDNYLGTIYRVDVLEESGENKKLHLIFKCSTRNEAFRDAAPFKELYTREVLLYHEIFPAYANFEKKFGVKKPFSSYAKYYKSCTNEVDEVIILENMKEQGFFMKDRFKTLCYNDCKLILEVLGHFHGISLAMKEKEPVLFKKLVIDNLHNVNKIWLGTEIFKKNVDKMAVKALKSIDKNKYPVVYEKYNKFKINLHETLMELMSDENSEYAVILHSDTWINNMLFRNEKRNTIDVPTELCLLDWQETQYGSPARDLSYFFYNCTSKELRDENFDNLIQIYYSSVSKHLSEMGCDASTSFPFSALEAQMKTYFPYGLIMATYALQLFTSSEEDVLDLEQAVTENENINVLDAVDFDSKNIHIYNERISGSIIHAVEYGYI